MAFDLTGLGGLFDFGSKLIDRLIPDPAQKLAAQQELLKLTVNKELAEMANDTALAKAQTDINQVEAASENLFKSGWRPFIGWVCGLACAWNWLGLPIAKFVQALIGNPVRLSPADLSEMWPLLMGMLGIGTLRTFEKYKKVA